MEHLSQQTDLLFPKLLGVGGISPAGVIWVLFIDVYHAALRLMRRTFLLLLLLRVCQVAEQLMTIAYESGVNLFDTAEVYSGGK